MKKLTALLLALFLLAAAVPAALAVDEKLDSVP